MNVQLKVTGGKQMQRYLEALEEAVGDASGVRVGFLENATYPATPSQPTLHVATVAFWNTFGTSRAPARPFFQQMIGEELGDWGDKLAALLKANNFDAAKALGLMGIDIKDALTNKIASWPADNAPSTVARKGFNHGLIDKAIMERATDYEVLGT